MPTFRYEKLTNGENGAAAGAMIDAPDRAAAVRILRERGITATAIEELRSSRRESRSAATEDSRGERSTGGAVFGNAEPTPIAGGFSLGRRAMSRSEMASFVRELATAIQAGLPLVQALKTITRQGRTARQKVMLEHLIHSVESGKSMGDAAASWGKPFTDLTVNLIRAGEASGRLGEVLDQAANLLDKDLKLRRSLLGATMYPIILTGLVSIAVVVVVTVIVPRILGPLAGQLKTHQLPLPTRIVQAVAAFVGGYWWLLLLLAFLTPVLISRIYAKPAARLRIDRVLLKSPILGRLLRDVAVARFTRTLGTLVSAGLPALTALRVTRATLGNRAMEREIEHVCDEVASGKTIADPMERSGYFPPLLVQIVGVGERSGRLPQMLSQAATAFEERTETSVKLFTTALPPVLVVALAGVVGFVVAAILLPLLQMQEAIG
jgi:type II secretory pathway component PulF